MSADYDRLFHSSEPGKPVDDATAIVDRDAILKRRRCRDASRPSPVGEPSATDIPVDPAARTAPTQTQSAAQPRHAETPQMPAPMPQPPATAPQWPQNPMLRAPQQQFGPGARHEQARQAPGPLARVAPGPAPSHFTDMDPEISGAWRAGQAIPTPAAPGPTSAATMGNHRAIDALSHVGVTHRGEDAVAARLAALAISATPDQYGSVAR